MFKVSRLETYQRVSKQTKNRTISSELLVRIQQVLKLITNCAKATVKNKNKEENNTNSTKRCTKKQQVRFDQERPLFLCQSDKMSEVAVKRRREEFLLYN